MGSTERLAAILGVLLVAGCGRPPLTGSFRTDFIKGATEACARKEAGQAMGVSESDLQAYCACSAVYIADRTYSAELILAKATATNGQPPLWLRDLIAQAGASCRERYLERLNAAPQTVKPGA